LFNSTLATCCQTESSLFRFEAFNWLNHTLLGNPSTNLADANFGRITGLAGEPRNIQFGLKYNF
jgi:hypothetical protein